MLTPEYLWDVADPVVDIWEELNIAMIIDICERLMSADLYDFHQLPGAARYEAWLANQYGMHYEEMVKVIAKLTKKSEAGVKKLFEEAGLLTLENDQMIYDNHNISPIDIRNNSTLSQMLTEMYTRTNGELKNYTRTTLQNMPDEFYHAMDKAYTAVASGVESYSKAISDTVEELSKEGTHVTYPTGHKDSIDVAVRRAVLTGLNQGAAQISLQNAIDNGYEYVVVDAHLGARVNNKNKIANHAGWQGKIFKIEGKTKDHGNLKEETGFPGDPLGLCGYNCRHNFYPYMLGDPNPFEEDIPDEKENRKAYENSQKQRSMERKIQESKRNLMGLQTCIDNCKDEKAKFELQMEYDKKAAVLQRQNKKYKDFCEKNNLRTENERVKIAKWDRESADQARGAAKRYSTAKKSHTVMKSKFSENLLDYNNGQKDIITHRNIEKELNKSEIGKQIIKYLSNNPTAIMLCYNMDFPEDVRGLYEPFYDEIYINVSRTKTVARTAETIIHEVTHKRFAIGDDLKSEVICIMQEHLHRKRVMQLTYGEIRDIIKEVKKLYPEFDGIWRKK